MITPRPRFAHGRQDCLHRGKWGEEVDLEDLPVEVQVGLSDRGVEALTGVVDEHVDPTVDVEDAFDEGVKVAAGR